MRERILTLGLILVLAIASGCMVGIRKEAVFAQIADQPITQVASPNWSQRYGIYQIEMNLNPLHPAANERASVEFFLWDLSEDQPKTVSGALMACTSRMPEIAGHIHVLASHAHHPEVEPGRYTMPPVTFGMGGRWEVLLQLQPPKGDPFYAVFSTEIQGPPWPRGHVFPEESQPLSREESIEKRLEDSKKQPKVKPAKRIFR
jgi:hypothetical protein